MLVLDIRSFILFTYPLRVYYVYAGAGLPVCGVIEIRDANLS